MSNNPRVLYVGIDPGKSGGVAILHPDRLEAWPMAVTERDLLDQLEAVTIGEPAVRAVVERVHAFPKMGVVSAFTFGRGFGAILMALTAARIPFDLVAPKTWQTALSCLSAGDKNITKRRAQQLFPEFTVTHATADALLIAEYCRRAHLGQLRPTGKGVH